MSEYKVSHDIYTIVLLCCKTPSRQVELPAHVESYALITWAILTMVFNGRKMRSDSSVHGSEMIPAKDL